MNENNEIEVVGSDDHVLEAWHGSPDHPLRIGAIEIPCYVLEDGKRVLVQAGMLNALGLSQGTADKRLGGNRLTKFAETKGLSGTVNEDLIRAIYNPIKFRTPKGQEAYGYEATILADLCEAVLQARELGNLHPQQKRIAKQCEILARGFMRVGIVALVDEATGYQDVRNRQALEKILDQFIAKELARWAKQFPDEFYKHMFRLKGWEYKPDSVKRPGVIGIYTNDLVYERLAPGVLDELRKKSVELVEEGVRKTKPRYFQWLTENIGQPELRSHLVAVVTLMKASNDWNSFMRLVDRVLPKWKDTHGQLEMFDQYGKPIH
jgi:hypothetical protein